LSGWVMVGRCVKLGCVSARRANSLQSRKRSAGTLCDDGKSLISRLLKKPFGVRLLKKAQMQGGQRCEARGVLSTYAAAPRERANAADGPFSAAC
jgi:hypothetical protein